MSNRRVKDIAYEADEFNDYDDDDYEQDEGSADSLFALVLLCSLISFSFLYAELGPEDKEQMRQGKIRTREALGNEYTISDEAIEEALWHYYYDISKTVSYLKSRYSQYILRQMFTFLDQYRSTQPKQPKQPSRFDQAATPVQTPQVKRSGRSKFCLLYLSTRHGLWSYWNNFTP